MEVKKVYYSFSEVVRKLGIKPHHMRYWQKKLNITPTQVRRRLYYTEEDLETFVNIKHLLQRGFTLSSIRRKLSHEEDKLISILKAELRQVLSDIQWFRNYLRKKLPHQE